MKHSSVSLPSSVLGLSGSRATRPSYALRARVPRSKPTVSMRRRSSSRGPSTRQVFGLRRLSRPSVRPTSAWRGRMQSSCGSAVPLEVGYFPHSYAFYRLYFVVPPLFRTSKDVFSNRRGQESDGGGEGKFYDFLTSFEFYLYIYLIIYFKNIMWPPGDTMASFSTLPHRAKNSTKRALEPTPLATNI